jgi:hypothetical protein
MQPVARVQKRHALFKGATVFWQAKTDDCLRAASLPAVRLCAVQKVGTPAARASPLM